MHELISLLEPQRFARTGGRGIELLHGEIDLDGVAAARDPGKRLDINVYTEGHKAKNAKKLPLNLLDALRGFAVSKTLREALGDELVDSYVKLRMAEWQDYTRHLTQWERDRTLDC